MNQNKQVKTDKWDGTERRLCLNHGAHEVLLKSYNKRIESIENNSPVSSITFRWMIGITLSVTISLFSISLYTSMRAISSLHSIEIKQENLIVGVESLKDDIKELKTIKIKEL